MKDLTYEAMEKAKRQNTSGNPQGAVKTLEDYLLTDPLNPKPRILLSNILIYNLDKFDFGIFHLDVILEREPDDIECLKAKVTALSVLKKFNKQSDEIFRRLVVLDPSADVFSAYGQFLKMQMLDFKSAAEYFVKAIELEPNNDNHHIRYALVLLNDLKDFVTAKKELEIIIKLDPENYNARDNLTKLTNKHFDKDGNLKKGFSHKPRRIKSR